MNETQNTNNSNNIYTLGNTPYVPPHLANNFGLQGYHSRTES